MSNLLNKPKAAIPEDSAGKYESLNLKENPFPLSPYVNKNNLDIRYNGSIYESKIREKEFNQVVEGFLKVPQTDPNHIRLGYIQDNSYVGRGNGKSAFAVNLVSKINKEFCIDLSEGVNKCFGLHIAPEPSGRTKTFDSFVDSVFQAILELDLIKYSLASLRLEALMNIGKEFDLKEFNSDNQIIESLNSKEWFSDKKIVVSEITRFIYKNGGLNKISSDFPLYEDLNRHYNFHIVTQEKFENYYFKTLRKGKERLKFVFNDLILFFKASGFNGGFIIVDDFERIPDFQSEKLRQQFALELRTNFFDGIYENAKVGFLNLILVMHAGTPRLVGKAWDVSGLERRSPLSEDSVNDKHFISFEKLNLDHAKLLITKYVNEYLLDSEKNKFPFSDDAIALISEKCELNAASMLEKCHVLIEEAVKESKSVVDKKFVEDYFGKTKGSMEEEAKHVSTEETTDLFEKSKNDD
ncbi:hypothetical protein [Flagellimonas oceanensis]|uniref:hypothetical protein n=1 Tax=Flagellimonas oceanensis TaxID=2499163 RepID=UPI003BAC770D